MNGLHIDWIALGRVVAISTVVGVAIVSVFAIGILGLSRVDSARDGTVRTRSRSGYLLLVSTHGLCIAAVIYGLYWLVPQFHR
ncbi:hypothetical protein JF770_15080 [Mycobacterium intracellulare]|jgi:hypothetical protein|uniref:Transmembrane protein n=1 Tax=Mycobacterium intracellulare TaxID=1767 RepID=A0AAE4RK13_MYCIT|nr:hypothetical protein [Mycobacterium intracellulare]MCA2304888.1 hypothetical protein [Mycobacterium intracellulare]MCA2347081.1 hypothetical protein [Mycobacterium intracellulare]MDV6979862.1 hypothetical protein [Mycobacterium intracellulare]MDV6985411.1 hypothetical protein [Mycobacterium intracellulare]MDV7015653.1 hypothetical protein [Mycobacterium intracellulare]